MKKGKAKRGKSKTAPKRRTGGDWAPRFLKALAECGVVRYAAKAAGKSRAMVYKRRGEDKEFAEAMDAAMLDSIDVLEYEAVRRGKEGVRRPVYQGKSLVGYVREYSDNLLMFVLKKRDPRFRDRLDLTHSGPDGRAITIDHTVTDTERLAGLVNLAARLGATGLGSIAIGPTDPDGSTLDRQEPADSLGRDGA